MSTNNLVRLKTKRVVIIGDGAVGKTTLVQRLLNDSSYETTLSETKRTPFMNIEMLHIDQEKILVYDLAGQQSGAHPLKLLPDQILGTVNIIILTFALNQFSSLAHLEQWYSILKDYYQKQELYIPPILLVGTKCDQPSTIDKILISRVMQNEQIIDYIETSSTTGEGLEMLKNKLVLISECDFITDHHSISSLSYAQKCKSLKQQYACMKKATI